MELRLAVKQRLRPGNIASLIEELEREVGAIEDKAAKAAALFELAEVCEDLLLRKDRAMVHYQAAFKLAPENRKALSRARAIYWEMGNLEMYATLLGLELKATEEGASDRAELQGRLGIALLDLGKADDARPHLESATAALPNDVEIADALRAANYDREDWLGEAERLAAQAEKSDTSLAARMYLRVARTYRFEVPTDPVYIESLQKTVSFEPQHEQANFLLEGALGSQKRFEDIVKVHEKRAYAAPGEDEQAQLYRRFAAMWSLRWNDVERSAQFYRKAVEVAYGDGVPPAQRFAGHLAAFAILREVLGVQKGDWQTLLKLADLGLMAPLDKDETVFLALAAGEIAWKELKDSGKAKAYAEKARAVAPEAVEAMMRDKGASTKVAKASALISAIVPDGPAAPAAAAQASTEKKGKKKKKGEEAEVEAEAPKAEVQEAAPEAPAPEPVVAKEPSKPEPAQAAPVAEVKKEPSRPVVEAMSGPAPEDDISDAVQQQMEAAKKAESGSADKGIEAWRKIIQTNGGLRTPRRELARLYRQTERWNALIELYKDTSEKMPGVTVDEKVATLWEMVQIYREKLKLDVMVVNTFNAILAAKPSDEKALEALGAQYEAMKRWPDLIGVLQKKAALVEGLDDKIALNARIANLFQEKFSNVAEAIKAYEKVLELDPSHGEAIAYLKANYEKRRDWEKLIAVNQREIERLNDPAERTRRLIEVAKLASDKLKKAAVSIEAWQRVLDSEVDHPEALGELEKLYEREKMLDKLAEVIERQVELTDERAKKIAALQKLGLLYTEKLSDPDKATAAWRALLEVEPENKRAQDALKKLYLTAKNFEELERFYAAQNKYDEYIRVLERQVETEDDASKILMNTKIAELYRDRLQKADRAMRAYEKVLSLDASHLATAESLIPLYEGAKDWKKLVDVLAIQLKHTEEGGSREGRLKRLAELSEQSLRDKPAAFGWMLKLFAEQSDAEWVREEAERLAKETGQWSELAGAYSLAAEKMDAREALPLRLVLGRVLEEELRETDRALEVNAKILEVEPENPQAILALERLYINAGRFGELLGIYETKLKMESDKDAQKEIRYKIASLIEQEVKDGDGKAIAAYQSILDENGDELPALKALDRIYENGKKWAELVDVMVRELALLPVDDLAGRVQVKYRLGAVKESQLSDVAGAIEQYRDILDLDASYAGAMTALEKRLSDKDHQVTVAAILEPVYTTQEAWQKLVDVHEIQVSRESNNDQRVSLLLRIGELQGQKLGNAEKSFDAYTRAFKLDPSSTSAREELERAASILDAWQPLASLYDEAIDKLGGATGGMEQQLLRDLLLAAAALYDDKLDKSDKAVEYFRRAQNIATDDVAVLASLEKLYQKGEKWPELVEVLKKRVELTPDAAERETIYFRMAFLYEDMLSNADEAIAAYKEVLAQDPVNMKGLKALDRLYLGKGNWHELADNLTRQLQLSEDNAKEQGDLLVRLGALREKELGEVAAAVDTFRQAVDLNWNDERAVTALERLGQIAEHEQQVATILEPLYKQKNDWAKLISTYEVLVRHAMDPARKIELLHQIGELYEMAGDDGIAAFSAYDRALREEPSNKETLSRLERLARQLDRWSELASAYSQVAEQVSQASGDVELQTMLLQRVAQIYEQNLSDDAQAAQAYARVLKVAPDNLAASQSLEQLYLRGDQYPKLVEVILAQVDIVSETDQKKERCFKAAKIYEEILENLDKAIEVYRQVLFIDENDRTALDSLERLYIRLERWEPLKDIYTKKASLAGAPEDKKQMLFVLGQVYDRELKDLPRAIETYQGILDIDPNDTGAISALDRLYGQSGRWYDLMQILEREVELSGSTGETVALKYRIGQLWEKELKDLGRSVESYREVLSLDGGHAPTLTALDALVHGEQEPVLAAEVLRPLYEATGEWEKLIDVIEVMVKFSDDALKRVELLHQIADYYERRLEMPVEAFRAHARAIKEDGQNEQTLAALERLAGQIGSWEELAELYEGEVTRVMDPTRQVDMLLRQARVYEEELQAQAKAIRSLERALEAEPDNRAAILGLDRLLERTEQWPKLGEVLKKEIRLADNDQQIVALQFRLAQLEEQALKNVDAAIDVYREILGSAPTHGPTLSALELIFAEGTKTNEIAAILEPLYRNTAEWEKLSRVYEAQLQKLGAADERAQMIQRIAEIHEQRMMDQGSAFGWWTRAVKETPTSELVIEEVERLARETGSWGDLVATYNAVLESERRPDVQRPVLMRVARAYESELQDYASAEDAYIRVLGIDVKDSDALASLDRIYTQSGSHEQLAEILGRRIETTSPTDELIELNYRRGRVFEDALASADEAVASYSAILELDSRNTRALESLERVFFVNERWTELYGVYEKMMDVAPGDEGMAECYMRMARIASHGLNDRDKAIDLWGRVLDLRNEDPIALGSLADLHESAENWSELVSILERIAGATHEPNKQIPIYQRLGRIRGEKLSDQRGSLDAWNKVLELDPRDWVALEAMARIYQQTQAWQELTETLHRLIEIRREGGGPEDGRQLVELYTELGALEGEILMRPQQAIDAWREVLAINPAEFRALGALETLFTQEARWEECIEVLERKVEVLEDTQARIDVLLQVASIWEDKIGDRDRAGEVYERILQLDAQNMSASVALEQVLRHQGRWDRFVELLLARVEFTPETSQKIATLQQVADAYEKQLNDQEGAFVVLQAAFRESYSDPTTSAELERLATATNKWNDLLGEYTQVVQTIEDPKSAADLWVKIGRWYGEHLGHLDYAVASEKQALQLEPNHKEALAALADFLRKTSRWGELADILQRHAEVEDDAHRRADINVQLARLYEGQLSDQARAVEAYKASLDAEASPGALESLERIYRGLEQWPELIEVLSRRAGILEDTEAVTRLKQTIGQLYEERLGDAVRAISSYKDILTVDPQNVQALKSLERLYEKTGENEKYLDVLEQQLDVSGNNDERISLYERMAAAWEEQFRKPERAWEALEKILLIDDRHEPTYLSLERLYRQEKRATELVDTLRRHIMAVQSPAVRADLYAQMGEAYELELKDLDRAIESYSDILSFDANSTIALGSLSKLYEKIENWDRSIEHAGRLAEVTEDRATKVELNARIGRIYDERLKDPDTAEARYLEALGLDPTYLPAMTSLSGLYGKRGDWLKAAQMMVKAEEQTLNQLDKVKLLFEAGKIFRDKLENELSAGELFARVLELDPEHVEAAEPLAEIYFRDEKWRALEPIVDMLVRKSEKKDNKELNQLYFKAARAADELGAHEKALKYYKLAYDLDSTFLPTLLGRGALLYKMEDWDGAFKIYQTILVHHRESQKEADVVEVFYRLGNIKLKQGERKKALNMFEKALEIQATHRPTLESIVELQAGAGEHEAMIHAKRSLAAIAENPEKFKLLDEIGDVYREKLQNPQKSIAAYLEALDVKTDNHVVLHKLLDLYSETKQWKKAIEIIVKIAGLEIDPVRRGKYFHAAARIERDELKSQQEAIELFNQALDSYFESPEKVTAAGVTEYLKAFEAIDKICTQQKEFKEQERNYRRMLKRMQKVPGQEQLKVALLHALGEIYRSRLKDYRAAIESFDLAAKLEPGNQARHEILAELYVMGGPEYAGKAVAEHITLIKRDPFRVDSYKALRKLYMDLRQYDKAWCLCAALAYLQRADQEEMQFYEQYRKKGSQRARTRISDEMWVKNVFHPDEDRYIGAIFAAVWQAVALRMGAEHKKYNLKRKDRRDLAKDETLFAKTFVHATQVLNVPLPEVYYRPEQAGMMQLANTIEKGVLIPSLVVYNDMLQGRTEKELAFPIASFLTMLRPEHYLRRTIPTNTELGVAFMAAVKLVQPSFPVPANQAQAVEHYVQVMNATVQPAWREQLAVVVQQFIQRKGSIDLTKWTQAVELTSHRAGFIISGDLSLSAKYVQIEPTTVGGLSTKDKVKELVLYAISEEYFELRQHLGLTIE